MTKAQYKRLLQLRRSEELFFFGMILAYAKAGMTPREVIEAFPINHKRAWYILEKWSRQGKYDYGVLLDLGWII